MVHPKRKTPPPSSGDEEELQGHFTRVKLTPMKESDPLILFTISQLFSEIKLEPEEWREMVTCYFKLYSPSNPRLAENLRAKKVFESLVGQEGVGKRYITAGDLQKGFQVDDNLIFFPNIEILQAYWKHIMHQGGDGRFREFLKGPIAIGKSYNLALFKLLLQANYKQYRVIYFHNISSWLDQHANAWTWLRRELVYTFMDELQNNEENLTKYENFFAEQPDPFRLKTLFNTIFPSNGKQLVLLLDQYNVLLRTDPVSNLHIFGSKEFSTIQKCISTLKDLAEVFLTVSSMTGETVQGILKVQENFINGSLSPEVQQKFVHYVFKDQPEQEIIDNYSELVEITNGNPGELRYLQSMKGLTIPEKIAGYLTKRLYTISTDLQDFVDKRKKSEDNIEKIMQRLSIYIDLTKVPLPIQHAVPKQKYDGRYILIDDDGFVSSAFPLVRHYLRITYFELSDTRDHLSKIISQTRDSSVYGKLLEHFLIKGMDSVKSFTIILKKHVDETAADAESVVINLRQERFFFNQINEIVLDPHHFRLFQPQITTFLGIGFLIMTPDSLFIIQVKSVLDTQSTKSFTHFIEKKYDSHTSQRTKKTREEIDTLIDKCAETGRTADFVLLYLQRSEDKIKDIPFKLWSVFDLPPEMNINCTKIRL